MNQIWNSIQRSKQQKNNQLKIWIQLPKICKFFCSELYYLEEEEHSKSSIDAGLDIFLKDISNIKQPFENKEDVALDFTILNLLRPNHTSVRYILPRNEHHHFKLLLFAFEQ